MKYWGLSYQEVTWGVSYINLMMLSMSIPGDESKKEPEQVSGNDLFKKFNKT